MKSIIHRVVTSLLLLACSTVSWAADVVIKEGRIPIEIFTAGKKYLIETQHAGVPIRIFLPAEAFSHGGILSSAGLATVHDDVSTSILTKNFLYFYLNDEGTSPSWQYSGGTSMLMTFFDAYVQSMSTRANMEYKIQAPSSPGFPIARIEAYPEPHEVNSNIPAPSIGTVPVAAFPAPGSASVPVGAFPAPGSSLTNGAPALPPPTGAQGADVVNDGPAPAEGNASPINSGPSGISTGQATNTAGASGGCQLSSYSQGPVSGLSFAMILWMGASIGTLRIAASESH